jgi:hypothetical protein
MKVTDCGWLKVAKREVLQPRVLHTIKAYLGTSELERKTNDFKSDPRFDVFFGENPIKRFNSMRLSFLSVHSA